MKSPDEDPYSIRDKLNSETAKIPWRELQHFFAAGKILHVEPYLDLIDVALAMHQDNTDLVQHWLDASRLSPVNDTQAKDWYASDTLLWATVVKPWVLVQSSIDSQHRD